MKQQILCAVLLLSILSAASQERTQMIDVHAGYGTENNFGSTGFFAGLGWSGTKGKKWIIGTGISRFTTSLYNAYDGEDFDGEQQDYKAWFLTPKLGYTVAGRPASFFSGTVFIGPSLKYFTYKIFKHGLIRYYFDGRREPVEGTITWYEDRGINLSLFTGISFDFRLSDRVKAGLFLDTYSHKIWIEHFLPGVKVEVRMKNKE